MRSRLGALIGIALLLCCALPAFSQETSSLKIPRRVYFAPAVVVGNVDEPAIKQIPDFLYTAISSRQPIVRVDSADKANSVIEVAASSPGPSIEVRLLEKGALVKKVSFLGSNFSDLARFIEKTAVDLAPHLGFVEPKVEQVGGGSGATGNQALVQRVQLAEKFAKPIELSIDGLGFTRLGGGDAPPGGDFGFDLTPVVLNFVYFSSRSLGLQASLLTYYGDRLSFGTPSNSTLPGPWTRALLLLPGIGVKYRSLGTLFASFSANLYAGYGYVTNVSSQAVGSNQNASFQVFLNPGASASIFYMLIRFVTGFGYNLSPQWAINAGVTTNLSPAAFGNNLFGYPSNGNSFFLQYLTFGASYRP